MAISLTFDRPHTAFLLVEGGCDSANFGEGCCGKDDTLGAAFGYGGGAVGYVEAVAGAGGVVEGGHFAFAYGERFTGEKGFVGFEVFGFEETVDVNFS